MCEVFIGADPNLYASRARSVRLHGVVTSIRLENLFWRVLEEIAGRDGMSVPQLCTRLHDELQQAHGSVENFTSFLRVSCGRYLALQLAGGIPSDPSIPIRSLDARQVLAAEWRQPTRPLAHPSISGGVAPTRVVARLTG